MPTKLFMVLKELIDTCWDVNADFLDIFGVPDYELIDTCWDVNV